MKRRKLQQEFGALVRAQRRAQEITQIQVALAIGRSQAFVYAIEHGYTSGTADDRARIVKYLRLENVEVQRAS